MFSKEQYQTLKNATLKKLSADAKIGESPQKPVERFSGGSGRVIPKKRRVASGGQPRPFKSRFKVGEIRREGPSTDTSGTVWNYAHTVAKRKGGGSGEYKGPRWSPAPSARNWQKQPLSAK